MVTGEWKLWQACWVACGEQDDQPSVALERQAWVWKTCIGAYGLWRGVLTVVAVVSGEWKPCCNRKWKLWLVGTDLVCGNSKMVNRVTWEVTLGFMGCVGTCCDW